MGILYTSSLMYNTRDIMNKLRLLLLCTFVLGSIRASEQTWSDWTLGKGSTVAKAVLLNVLLQLPELLTKSAEKDPRARVQEEEKLQQEYVFIGNNVYLQKELLLATAIRAHAQQNRTSTDS